MSIRIMSMVWADAPYRGSVLLLLLALAGWANEAGTCWPSLPTIAKKTRLGTRQVNNILKRLLADQVISIENKGGVVFSATTMPAVPND
jgi:Helix-turn-helix domain